MTLIVTSDAKPNDPDFIRVQRVNHRDHETDRFNWRVAIGAPNSQFGKGQFMAGKKCVK